MKAIVFTETGKFEYTDYPEPQLKKDDDVKFKIIAASICGTDVHLLSNPPGIVGTPGIVLGHECVGEVVEVGTDVISLAIGDRIIFDNNVPCGVCPACQTGNSNLCQNMGSMGVFEDGVFAQYAVAPERQMVKIPLDIPLDQAIFAEPLNCVMGAIKKLKVMPGDNVLVLGGGPIGLYFTTLLKASGAGKVLVSEVSEFRTKYAYQQGANRVIHPLTENLVEVIKNETNGQGVDIVIDAVGVLLADAIKAVKRGGSILLFGQNDKARQEISQGDIVSRGLTIYGNFIGHYTLYNVAKLLNSGIVDFSPMITHRLALSDFGIGLDAMRKGVALEVVLDPWA
ncbi:MAG: alcohol dehydrogenase catalytic domain-containing protein [Clostridiales Family XIII bacterium]|nr:alcohol dehydrogenase catalytic domain-containing protein [Clostridiales Family XIII bacterium]